MTFLQRRINVASTLMQFCIIVVSAYLFQKEIEKKKKKKNINRRSALVLFLEERRRNLTEIFYTLCAINFNCGAAEYLKQHDELFKECHLLLCFQQFVIYKHLIILLYLFVTDII